MNLFAAFADRVEAALAVLQGEGVLPADIDTTRVAVEPPRDASHGDISTNAAMVLAKPAGLKPRDLAERLAEELRKGNDVADVGIAGPGFINLTLETAFWPRVVAAILAERDGFGRSDLGGGAPVNVEYVSANPTGPMHVGHCRGAVFGDALANLLAFTGHAVTREYYMNDTGAQIETLACSAYLRYREALGEDIGPIPEGLYPGDYLVPVGEELAREHGDSLTRVDDAEWLPIVRDKAVAAMMDAIREDLKALGIAHDVFFSELSLMSAESGDAIRDTMDELMAKGLIYEGRLPPPKGKLPDDWEDREQTLFRATDFGDDVDRALLKSDGTHTYFAADMAYHRDKLRRGFNHMIDVWGADHAGYVKRMKAAVAALSEGEGDLDVKICQLVRLFRDGQPVKMSKRAGEFVTLREVVDEVGPDAVRFMMLYRKNDAVLDFDFVKVTEQSRDNPVFYVQYAHARAHSVMRNTKAEFEDFDSWNLEESQFSLLENSYEIDLIKILSHYPRVVGGAAAAHEPHRIAFYLNDLAAVFHGLWNRGKELPQLRFINSDNRDITMARVALIAATSEVLASGLSILGVQAIREMR